MPFFSLGEREVFLNSDLKHAYPPAPFPSQPNVSKWIQEWQSCVEQNLHFVFLAKLWQSTLEINTQTKKKTKLRK